MFKVKHFMDAVETDDGVRMWVEPMGLTADLAAWCKISHVLPHLGPPRALWDWFEANPNYYEYFRGRYHEYLATGPYAAALRDLAAAAAEGNYTLLHQSEDPAHNSATALYEFVSELGAHSQFEA